MSDFSFKNNKQIEIVKEMVKTSSDRYEINGIVLSKARFMWRKFQEAFQILSPGSYSIIQEAGNTFLKIDDTVLLGEAIEFQVIYVFDQESSQYIDDFPDVSILKEKYNELQRDFTNLNRLLKSNNITGDTLKMFYVLPELNEGEVWIRTKDGWKGTNVADLDKIVQDLINKIENEIKPDLTIWIKNELAKIQNRIDELMVHDYIDIPFLNKNVVQIYIDTDTKTVRECDNTKFEPLSAIGLKFIKEDGTTVTRCYFRGVYDKPATLNIQDGVYWQTHTSTDGLTLIQPQKWKSQAFELSNGKMYFDRGNPILLQGELGTIVFKEYETLNQAKADSSLVNGDYVIVTGDTQTNDGGQGVYQLVSDVFELRDFNRSFLGQKLDKQDTIEDLKKSTQYAVGDVVEVLGYHAKGDGSHHKRIAKSVDDGSGELGVDGLIWCILHDGEVNVSWFGNINKSVLFSNNYNGLILNVDSNVVIDSTLYFRKEISIIGSGGIITSNIETPLELGDRDIAIDETQGTVDWKTQKHYTVKNCIFKNCNVENLIKINTGVTEPVIYGNTFTNIIPKSSNSAVLYFGKSVWNGVVQNNLYSGDTDVKLCKFLFNESYGNTLLKIENNLITSLNGLNEIGIDIDAGHSLIFNNKIEGWQNNIRIGTESTGIRCINNYFEMSGSGEFGTVTIAKRSNSTKTTLELFEISNCYSNLRNVQGVDYKSFVKFEKDTGCLNGIIKNNFLNNYSTSGATRLNGYIVADDASTQNCNLLIEDNVLVMTSEKLYTSTKIIATGNQSTTKFNFECSKGEFAYDGYAVKNRFFDKLFYRFFKDGRVGFGRESLDANYHFNGDVRAKFLRLDNVTTSPANVPQVSLFMQNDNLYFKNQSNNTFQLTGITQLDTPYYTRKMEEEGIYEDYVVYRDELHEYENSQTSDKIMLLPVLQEPVIPDSIRVFAEKYKLI